MKSENPPLPYPQDFLTHKSFKEPLFKTLELLLY